MLNPQNPKLSVASSVYSPIEGDFKLRISTLRPAIIDCESDHDDPDYYGSTHSDLEESYQYQLSNQTMESFQTAYLPGAKLQNLIPKDNSNTTMNSYETAKASDPSFSSMTKPLMQNQPSDSEDAYSYDPTPLIAQLQTFDDMDKTPIIGAWPEDHSNTTPEKAELATSSQPSSHTSNSTEHATYGNLESGYKEPGAEGETSTVPEVASKFTRLSETLLKSRLSISRESQQFQLNFSLNVQQANTRQSKTSSRVSSYYDRIHLKPKEHSISEKHSEQDLGNHSDPLQLKKLDAMSINDDTNSLMVRSAHDITATSNDSFFSESAINEIDMSALFIRALHSFDSTKSQIESSNSVCLSFEKGDLAFTHTIDESGWAEVTLLETLDRGWVPMNFFAVAVNDEAQGESEEDIKAIQYARYMKPLLDSCGKYLLNPISHTSRTGVKTFSIKIINAIRDGVRFLLQETDCLSRSNEIVIKKPVVRKCRKVLLSDWYNLMVKAAEFRRTVDYDKIEILTLLVLQVVRRATTFFEVWSKENDEILKKQAENALKDDLGKYPTLANPPYAKQRILDINGVLFSYLALIYGRLDLVEHNPEGCEILETVVHHVILLLRELLYISKTGSEFLSERAPELDNSLDALLSLVSEIVGVVKSLVAITLSENDSHRSMMLEGPSELQYSYTHEGKRLMLIAAKMITSVGATIASIRRIFDNAGDFKLGSERSYPDFSKLKIEPDEFIRSCSVGLVKSLSVKVRDLRLLKQNAPRNTNRYSTFRSGKLGELGITANGADALHHVMLVDTEGSSSFSSQFKEFMTTESDDSSDSVTFSVKDELLVDADKNLLGASFKGLIYTLTNETSAPEYFFVSTFFICFRNFASGQDLAELLIGRFECKGQNEVRQDMMYEVNLKNRRKLVCKMFQIWLESYWDQAADSPYLSTFMNFFNEGVFKFLPQEAMKLIELTAKLVDKPANFVGQFVTRSISLAKLKRKNSFINSTDSETSINTRYSMVDGYELSKINTNSSVSSSLKSMTLPLPLGVSGATTATSSLLTKSQLSAIESLVTTYRKILGEHWCPTSYLATSEFVVIPTRHLLPRWYAINDQNWVLSNYRPNLLDFNGLEIAKQFTLIESEIFGAIQPTELINGNYTAKKSHLKLAGNVRKSLLFTNSLSEYVIETVLQPQINHKMRVNVIKTWLKIAISCLYLRNFNSLAAIITSLQSHLITRLVKIWDELSEKYTDLYEYLCGIIHPEKNYSVYRNKLRSFLLSNDYNIPVVPYFSLFLQDLTFVNDGNPNYRKANTFLNQKLINIDKYLKITRVIADIESLQIPYNKEYDQGNKSGTLYSFANSKKTGSPLNEMEDYTIASVPALKELILLELWKITQINKREEDRAWKLSCSVQPRDASNIVPE